MENRRVYWLTGVIASLLVLATLVAVPGLSASSLPQGIEADAEVAEDVSTAAEVTTAADAATAAAAEDFAAPAFWKIDSELRRDAQAGGKGWVQVDIVTVRNSELASVLSKYGARALAESSLEGRAVGAINFRATQGDGVPVTQRVWVPNGALAEISSLPGVISISPPLRPVLHTASGPGMEALEEIDLRGMLNSLEFTGIEYDSWPSIVEHKSEPVHTVLGIEGDGVSIAIVDTTVDFNQPNLVGRWATVTNTSSPYLGWPILLDSGTIRFNQQLWSVGSDFDRFPYPFFSSFGTSGQSFWSDTHYSTGVNATGFVNYSLADGGGLVKRVDPTGVSGVVDLSRIDRSYYVGDATDPNRIVSASGNYRLGILKDDWLTGFYGERVGLLLVDWATPGVYDTVYADLDFDLDFTNENPANVTQPRLYRDLDADGLADISGGIIYFISNTTNTVIGETVIASAAGNETFALLANGWVAVDIVDPFVDLGMPRLYLNGSYWPSSTDVIAETLFTSTGEEKGTTTNLVSGITLNDFVTTVDTAALLADYNLGSIYDFSSSIEGELKEGEHYSINMNTGEITWLRPLAPGADIDIAYQFTTWTVDFETGNITFDASPTFAAVVTADYLTGLPVPYSEHIANRAGYELFIPAAGDLVGVYGSLDTQTHGTGTASTAAGANTGLMSGGLFDTYGQAPGAKIISADIFKSGASITDAWSFAVGGINDIPGDRDDANISSNSWGFVNNFDASWDFFDRWQYHLITTTGVAFVMSAGNEGPGYGTFGGPVSPAAIEAGAGRSGDIWWLLGFAGGEQFDWPVIGTGPLGPGPYGDVSHFSSRGPTALGTVGVDALGIGDAGIWGAPVNEFGAVAIPPGSGADAWDLGSGTSEAAPNLAGILALMIAGYQFAHGGTSPTPEMLQAALKTSADDVQQDVLSQGAGFANAWRAVNAMMEMEGVTADVHEWVPGGYQGVSRDMFVNLLEAGSSDTEMITLTNRWDTPVTVDFSDGIYQRTGTFSFTFTSNNTGAGSFFFGRPDWWMLNRTGIWRTNDTPDFPGFAQEKAADLTALWDAADFMTVFTHSDPNIGARSSVLFLRDWNDTNMNGTWDGPGTEDSLIAPVVFFGHIASGRLQGQTIYNPGTRVHDGLAIGHGALFGTSDGTPQPTTIEVEFYARSDWSMLSLDLPSLALSAGASGTVNATVTVPAGTAPGSYQGAIYYNDGTYTSTIPVLVNVPVTTLPFSYGGGPTKGNLYEPNAFVRAQGASDDGDGRYFWVDTSVVAGANKKMLFNLGWGNISSDAEILAFHAVPETDARFQDNAIYGPNTFELLDATKLDQALVDTVEPFWEFLGTDVQEGLFFFEVQSLRMTEPGESMSGNLGVMTVNSNEVRVSSNTLAGSAPITVSANVPLRAAAQPDPADPTRLLESDTTDSWKDQPVTPYPYTGGPYVDYLFNATNRLKTEIPANAVENATWTLSFAGSDIDMGIFFDDDCDGVYTAADDVIGIAASGISNPEVASHGVPGPSGRFIVPEGCYWVHAAGFDVMTGDTYDLSLVYTIPVVQGLGTAVTESIVEVFADQPVDPYPFVSGDFVVYLFGAPNTLKTEVPAGTISASWTLFFHSGANDVDMGLFFDADCDGVYTAADDAIGTVASTGANPESASLLFPTPGCYWVHAAGFDVAPGSLYDLTFALNKIGVSAFVPANVPGEAVPADTPIEFNVTWTFGAERQEGVSEDFLFLSPGNAPFALVQDVVITFNYDVTPPSFSAHLPAPGATLSDSTPGIFVQIDDGSAGSIARRGEIDESTVRVWLDGQDITSVASISVPHVTNQGYPTGAVLFTPSEPLLDGAHTVQVQAGDFAGNLATEAWTFDVDTEAPRLDITSPPAGFATSAASITLTGVTEPGATVTVAGQPAAVDAVGGFSADVSLTDGANAIEVSATDAIGNVAATTVFVDRDSAAPAISQLRSSEGLLTNRDSTVISGIVDEPVTLTVAGGDVTVRADGSFEAAVALVEGSNAIGLVATDGAGNQGSSSLTIVRDSTPPVLSLDALPSETASATVTVSGTVESGINFVTVNGQPVPVSGGAFSADVALSFGSNEIFVEAADGAGNTKTIAAAVSYVPSGVTVASVGLILLPILVVVALLVGLILGAMRRRRPPEMGPPEGGGA